MNKREFNAQLRLLTRSFKIPGQKSQVKRLDRDKVRALSTETKAAMLRFLVRMQYPVMTDFVDENTDLGWLHSCGYIHRYADAGYEFICLCDHWVSHTQAQHQKLQATLAARRHRHAQTNYETAATAE